MPVESRGSTLLDPTWKRVASFNEAGPSDWQSTDAAGQDGQWEYEDEEELVTLDLGPDSKRLVQMSQEYSIAGLETATPFLQLGNLMFKGTWDQLIGTEILLQDDQQARKNTAYRGHEHELWPLPATPTDRLLNRAPSTTRRRIILRQATNMIAKEAALVPPDDLPPTGVHVHAPILRQHKTGYVTYKNWIWIRGHGWMRKEDASQLETLAGSVSGNTGNLEGAAPENQGADTLPNAEEQQNADEGLDDDDDDDGDDDDNDDDEEENDDQTAGQSAAQITFADNTIDTQADASVVNEQTQVESSRLGRKKMSEEEKVRYQLFRAMRKIANRRQAPDRDAEEQSGDED